MGELNVDDISVELEGARVVHSVTLDVPRGSFVGLVGPNGSGKSSLLRTIYRVLAPVAGRILHESADIWQMRARDAARRMAVVAQERMGEFDFLVEDIVMMGRTPHKHRLEGETAADRSIVETCLGMVSMADKAGRPFMSLSGGERQRVLVARALAQQPQFLVLDEPTNHLDIKHQLDLLALVRQLELTTLAALHDLNLAARYCDHLVMLDKGEVAASGPPAAVLTAERIAAVYEVGADVELDAGGVPHIRFFQLAGSGGKGAVLKALKAF